MPQLDLNHLIDLDALLTEGSVVRAARRLNLSAPAMSRRLARLRDALGDPLFVLAGRTLVPTERALALREPVRAAIEDVRGILTPPHVDFARLERTLVLRANDGFVGAWGARLAARMAAEAPGVSVRFLLRVEKGRDALRSGAVDLDLGALRNPAPEIHSRALLSSPLVGVVHAGHGLAAESQVSAEAFVRWPHLCVSRRAHVPGPIDAALQLLGLSRRIVVIAPGFQSALAMLQGTDYVAAIPEAFVQWSALGSGLHRFALPVATPPVALAMSWHPRRHADPVHLWLRRHVLALVAEFAAAPGGTHVR
ncbi:LysR family transcriptional regulator [Pseudomonas sp. RIT-PI-AD]|uniref:LysR family transcriptional regulator n=1 Tax=Pseudomonas sp. RIT-PI-AD TaxID=3035294 RepID=UPI0021D96055|nr:LysR family transcriptional regulator [Pseudomonas sp. RIT-PI-AD]